MPNRQVHKGQRLRRIMVNKNPYDNRKEKRAKNMYDFYVEWAKRNNVKPVSREEYMLRLWRGTSPKCEAPNA